MFNFNPMAQSFLEFYLKIDNSAVFGYKEVLSNCVRHLAALPEHHTVILGINLPSKLSKLQSKLKG
jgi:hypothetical protein